MAASSCVCISPLCETPPRKDAWAVLEAVRRLTNKCSRVNEKRRYTHVENREGSSQTTPRNLRFREDPKFRLSRQDGSIEPGKAAERSAARPLLNTSRRSEVFKSILFPVVLIALTDVALQLDNAIAISSVAASVPTAQRFFVVAVGVLLAAGCLFIFTLAGSYLVDRIWWLKPIAGLVLIGLGIKLALELVHR
jgi:hypothetical protein